VLSLGTMRFRACPPSVSYSEIRFVAPKFCSTQLPPGLLKIHAAPLYSVQSGPAASPHFGGLPPLLLTIHITNKQPNYYF